MKKIITNHHLLGTDKSNKIKSSKSSTENSSHNSKAKHVSSTDDSCHSSVTDCVSSTDSNCSDKSQTSVANTKIKREKNIGFLSKGKLRSRIFETTGIILPKSPKRNRNGKVGVSRKKCFNCGNTNHIAMDCKKSRKKDTHIHISFFLPFLQSITI